MNELNNHIYVEIDTVFDTRASLLYRLDKSILEKKIVDESYFTRVNDEFGYLPVDVFRVMYKERGRVLLEDPIVTKIYEVIRDYCNSTKHANMLSGKGDKLKVYLNVFPYDLKENELKNIALGLRSLIQVDVDVIIINKDITELTTDFLNKNIGLAIMYDGLSWIEYRIGIGDLISNSIPDMMLLTPRLIHKRSVFYDADNDKLFEDLEKKLSYLINILFIDVSLFSIKK